MPTNAKTAGPVVDKPSQPFSLFSRKTKVDPLIDSLFSADAPTSRKHSEKPSSRPVKASQPAGEPSSESESSSSAVSSASSDDDDTSTEEASSGDEDHLDEADSEKLHSSNVNPVTSESSRKKRRRQEDDLEGKYLERLAQEDIRDAQRGFDQKRVKLSNGTTGEILATGATINGALTRLDQEDKLEQNGEGEDDPERENEDGDEDEEQDDFVPPQHESITNSFEYKLGTDFDKASRTVFLANVSNEALASKSSKKILIAHLKSFIPQLPESNPAHGLESLRFRSTAYGTPLPKRAAYARKELMDATTKSTNAYAVYTTKAAAREASIRLNGTVVLGRHLRVDEVQHPAKIEHYRCIFVGNLGYVDDDNQAQQAEAERLGRKQRKHPPGDVEEGLWQTFSKVGKVENVRVVRDPKTRVGKGFGYVQFADEIAVEQALLLDGKKFPPMLPRKLRISRAKKPAKKSTMDKSGRPMNRPNPPRQNQQDRKSKPHNTSASSTVKGRVQKLLGRAGAANMTKLSKTMKKPEDFIFEGFRASSKKEAHAVIGKTTGAVKKKSDKVRAHSAKRGAAWKSRGASTKK